MFNKDDKLNNEQDRFERTSNVQTNSTKNPFIKDDEVNIFIIFDKLKQETENLNCKCYPNTYVWIEKFKDDNYIE